jgi:predicted metal-dependent HD superfamily phosphohydrolase
VAALDVLRSHWFACVGHASGPPDRTEAGVGTRPEAALDELVGRYRESHRQYHTVKHLELVVHDVAWLLRQVEVPPGAPAPDGAAVVLAAFFHDAVYDARASDNEAQSAALSGRVLGELGVDPARISEVERLVLATAHLATPTPGQPGGSGGESTPDVAAHVLLDADLAILGAEPAVYDAYVNGVRHEYAHLDDDQWATGRRMVLDGFLRRASIYLTAPMHEREPRARANLTAELATLE